MCWWPLGWTGHHRYGPCQSTQKVLLDCTARAPPPQEDQKQLGFTWGLQRAADALAPLQPFCAGSFRWPDPQVLCRHSRAQETSGCALLLNTCLPETRGVDEKSHWPFIRHLYRKRPSHPSLSPLLLFYFCSFFMSVFLAPINI